MLKKLLLISISVLVLSSCQPTINQADLVGKWVYTKYESIDKTSENAVNLKEQKPFIVFKTDGVCEIYSSGKLLSKGNYSLDHQIIRYTEVLDGGIKRKIPFLVKELKGNQLIFETMEADVKRITAQKE
ncbi:hypothetical protein N9R54_05545 [Pelobium sp.]|nr:hypothetical protein [Pelobium sp.]MDA9555683.1 hypothetical protein [Pelobium sp.]